MKMINYTEIIKIISPNKNSIAKLIRKILIVEQQLENPENRSIYFRMALESKQFELYTLKKKYSKLVDIYNLRSIESLLEEKRHIEEKIKSLTPTMSRLIYSIAKSSFNSQISEINDFLSLKPKFPKLKALEKYTEEELLQFF